MGRGRDEGKLLEWPMGGQTPLSVLKPTSWSERSDGTDNSDNGTVPKERRLGETWDYTKQPKTAKKTKRVKTDSPLAYFSDVVKSTSFESQVIVQVHCAWVWVWWARLPVTRVQEGPKLECTARLAYCITGVFVNTTYSTHYRNILAYSPDKSNLQPGA